MKKSLFIIAIAALLGMSGGVQAQTCGCPEPVNTISVSASAVKEVAPDTVEINIEVQTEDSKSMQKAMTDNNEISQKILVGLKSTIKPDDGDYIKTSDFRADSLYKYNGSKRSFDKYMVTNNVVVHTKSIEGIPSIIEKAISLGATGISNLNFSVSNYDKYRDELLTLAVEKAKKQAQTAAVAANVTIKGGKIGEATVNNNDAVLTVEDATFTDAVTVSNTAGINANGTTNVTFTDCTFNKGISVNNDNKGTGVNAVTINGGSIEKASSKDAASTLTIGGGTARNNTVIIKGEVTADAVNVDQAYTDFKSTLDIQGDLTTNALEKAMTGHIDVNKDASLTLGEDAEYTLADALLRVEGTLTNNGTITVDGGKLVDIDQNNGNTGLFVNNGVLMVAANKVWYENQYITLRMENGDYVYTGIMSEKDFADALAVEGAKPTGLQVTAASFSFANDAFEDNKDFSNVDVIFSNSNAVEVTVPDGLKLGNVTIQAPVTIKAQGEEEAAIATGDLTVVKSGSLALSEDKVTVICVNLDVQKDATATQGGQISYTGTNKSQGTITGTPIQK